MGGQRAGKGDNVGYEVQGKCKSCKRAYRWQAPPKLRDAYCPMCGVKLSATTHLYRAGTWYNGVKPELMTGN